MTSISALVVKRTSLIVYATGLGGLLRQRPELLQPDQIGGDQGQPAPGHDALITVGVDRDAMRPERHVVGRRLLGSRGARRDSLYEQTEFSLNCVMS
jgi:hypothetical protein